MNERFLPSGMLNDAREHAADDPQWCHALLLELEKAKPGLGFAWVERCVRNFLASCDMQTRETLTADLESLHGCNLSREEILERARRAWYDPGANHTARRAVAKLLEAHLAATGVSREKYARALEAPLAILIADAVEPEKSRKTYS
jgi:hypothetical protein